MYYKKAGTRLKFITDVRPISNGQSSLNASLTATLYGMFDLYRPSVAVAISFSTETAVLGVFGDLTGVIRLMIVMTTTW